MEKSNLYYVPFAVAEEFNTKLFRLKELFLNNVFSLSYLTKHTSIGEERHVSTEFVYKPLTQGAGKLLIGVEDFQRGVNPYFEASKTAYAFPKELSIILLTPSSEDIVAFIQRAFITEYIPHAEKKEFEVRFLFDSNEVYNGLEKCLLEWKTQFAKQSISEVRSQNLNDLLDD